MRYNISEISKLLNITRVTVYNKKLDKVKDINKHIHINGKHRYIDDIGLEMIRQSLLDSQSCKSNTELNIQSCKEASLNEDKTRNIVTSGVYTTEYVSIQNEYIESLKNQIENLNDQLKSKDYQIHSLSDALGTSQKLNENNQILIKDSQQKIQLLEMRKEETVVKEYNSSLIELVKSLQSQIEQLKEDSNKGFWGKLLRRN